MKILLAEVCVFLFLCRTVACLLSLSCKHALHFINWYNFSEHQAMLADFYMQVLFNCLVRLKCSECRSTLKTENARWQDVCACVCTRVCVCKREAKREGIHWISDDIPLRKLIFGVQQYNRLFYHSVHRGSILNFPVVCYCVRITIELCLAFVPRREW